MGVEPGDLEVAIDSVDEEILARGIDRHDRSGDLLEERVESPRASAEASETMSAPRIVIALQRVDPRQTSTGAGGVVRGAEVDAARLAWDTTADASALWTPLCLSRPLRGGV